MKNAMLRGIFHAFALFTTIKKDRPNWTILFISLPFCEPGKDSGAGLEGISKLTRAPQS
jgi:hypothetical protein